jgi:predicted nucleic acid-binding protein
MIVVDSSVAIAAFASWNTHHQAAQRILDETPRLPAHGALETYSVLTRLPPPHRAPADQVQQFLDEEFPAPWLALSVRRHRQLISELSSAAITGGAVYDALIGAVAGSHQATLVSCDRRAAATYEAVGAKVRLIT